MLTYFQAKVYFDVSKKDEKQDKDLGKGQMPHVKQKKNKLESFLSYPY